MKLRKRIVKEFGFIYTEFRQIPLVYLIVLSCLALMLAASIAFGFHP